MNKELRSLQEDIAVLDLKIRFLNGIRKKKERRIEEIQGNEHDIYWDEESNGYRLN